MEFLPSWCESVTHAAETMEMEEDRIKQWLKDKINLLLLSTFIPEGVENYKEDLWHGVDHNLAFQSFCNGTKGATLFAFLIKNEERLSLVLADRPLISFEGGLYFIKCGNGRSLSELMDSVLCGTLTRGDHLEPFLRMLSEIFCPALLSENSWPNSVRSEFTGHLHKFMAALSEAVHERKGRTVLYTPKEDLQDVQAAAHDKDVVQRLESRLMHWTRQVREVLNQQDDSEMAERADPLAELHFWRTRDQDLSGITQQLDGAGVTQVVAVLSQAKSSSLPNFLALRDLIQREADVARNNLRFLQILEAPCEALAKAQPQDIPGMLPKLVDSARVVWNLSRFYNTPERMTSLLRKIANQIISSCCAAISLDQIFGGSLDNVTSVLEQSLEAGAEYRRQYNRTVRATARSPKGGWKFDESSVFAQIDAFLQRCRDLQEVCESRQQFGPQVSLPVFAGTRGNEVSRSIQEIQASFEQLLGTLRSLPYNVLDVKANGWYEDFGAFKAGAKDLEIRLVYVIQLAFATASCLSDQPLLLEALLCFGRRDSIRRCLEKKTADFHSAFLAELNTVKKLFDGVRRGALRDPRLPTYGGQALTLTHLLRRIQSTWNSWQSVALLLPAVPAATETASTYEALHSSLSQAISSLHNEWYNSVDASLPLMLKANVLAQDKSGGTLTVNFNPAALDASQEVLFWERLRMNIPYPALELNAQYDRHHVMRVNMSLLVTLYNRVVGALDREERRLFQDRLRQLDRRILPGISKLTWTSQKHALEAFHAEACMHCREAENMVNKFKAGIQVVDAECKHIAATLLLKTDKKRLFEVAEFAQVQADYQVEVQTRLKGNYDTIRGVLDSLQKYFEADSEEVQREWARFTQKVDRKAEEALRAAVRHSMQELLRLLNGDKRMDVVPIFTLTLTLERNNRIELKPTVQDLFNMVHSLCRSMVAVLTHIPRLNNGVITSRLTPEPIIEPQVVPSYHQVISTDEDTVLRPIVNITTSISGIVDKVQALLMYWEKKYKHVWEQDKEAYIRRYEKANKPLEAFEADISKYRELVEEIASEMASETIKFLFLDCGPLKQVLISHCQVWGGKFTALLNSLARQELEALHDYFSSNQSAMRQAPQTLEQLAEAVTLQERLQAEQDALAARFKPLRDKYRTLARFEVDISEREAIQLDELDNSWQGFRTELSSGKLRLEQCKMEFRSSLVRTVDSFVKATAAAQEAFRQSAPFSSEGWDVDKARAYLAEAKKEVVNHKATAASQTAGMDIFSIPHPDYEHLHQTEQDVEWLDMVWGIMADWQALQAYWKDELFQHVKVDDLQQNTERLLASIFSLEAYIKDWPVWSTCRDALEVFSKTVPVVRELRNPAMRPRHWDSLSQTVGTSLNPSSETFTLGVLLDVHIHRHADVAAALSLTATKELAIEQTLSEIETIWANMMLDMTEFKTSWRLRSTEEIFRRLDEHIVALSSMKASRYFATFQKEVSRWEKALNRVSETLEALLEVQQKWMFLENIFTGSEDISRQLPSEAAQFSSVNLAMNACMKSLQANSNVVEACSAAGLLGELGEMGAQLERIHQCLEEYLEAKRQAFPRFYFLSNDDLLEILSQTRDPSALQPFLKKLFEGVNSLELHLPGSEGRRTHEVTGILAPDGEYLPLLGALVPEGRPEAWLSTLEASMFSTTKRHLYKVMEDGKTTKKEKWVRDGQGQLLITASQIAWTAECEKALLEDEAAKAALRSLRKKWLLYLERLTAMIVSPLRVIDRNKVVALITQEVHARDTIEKLYQNGCKAPTDFDWLCQMRYYWDRDDSHCVVKQVLSTFHYGYEYQGNNGRLVITPITERCLLSLGSALSSYHGSQLVGPAGTGKTETVKEFGKALARFVVVYNCSEALNHHTLAKIFSGIAQSGAWACLDEVNRIHTEALSVMATHMSCFLQANKEGQQRFNFLGREISLKPGGGVFTTMNPGYGGRFELPDSLKTLFRRMCLMVPDSGLIAEVLLFSEGFSSGKALARKLVTTKEVAEQQLSKQHHYDYGLRSLIIPVTRAAGLMKRQQPSLTEEEVVLMAVWNHLSPKLLFQDVPLLKGILADLFPGVSHTSGSADVLQDAVASHLQGKNIEVSADFVEKVVQLQACRMVRHSNMLLGRAGSGKTLAWQTLQQVLTSLHEQEPTNTLYQKVTVEVINPLAVTIDDLYGAYSAQTQEWREGILTRILRDACSDSSPYLKWIVLDGPVEPSWIESMNSLLDDNRTLTLVSGERILLSPQVSILFEVDDLSHASPATVSRAGMVYFSVENLSWKPVISSFLAQTSHDPVLHQSLSSLFQRYVGPALDHRNKNCEEAVHVDEVASVRATCQLFKAFATPENGVNPKDEDFYEVMIELWFEFSIVWGIGGSLTEAGRRKFDGFMKYMDTRIPSPATVYEYVINPVQHCWQHWETRLPGSFRPPLDKPLHEVAVPTVDTVRGSALLTTLTLAGFNTLLAMPAGSGKTLLARTVPEQLPPAFVSTIINFSAHSDAAYLQYSMEGSLEKRSKGVLGPCGAQKLLVIVDDLNAAHANKLGFSPPLELIKQWTDYGFWYDRGHCEKKHVKDVQMMATLRSTNGASNLISQRLLGHFVTLYMTPPNDACLTRIFSTLLSSKLSTFEDSIKLMTDSFVGASISLYREVERTFLPTAGKPQYLFNLHHLARILQGVMQANRAFYDNQESMLQLWVHEALRVLGDRMEDPGDRLLLQNALDARLRTFFSSSWEELFDATQTCPSFVSFLRTGDNPPYEAAPDMKALKDFLASKLLEHDAQVGVTPLQLVLFKDAIQHVCRIHRAIYQLGGHALLVGFSGSGRKSLAKLVAHLAHMHCFTVEVRKGYKHADFRSDLKSLYKKAGVDNQPIVFLIEESQLIDKLMLADIETMVSKGVVPHLFSKEDVLEILQDISPCARREAVSEQREVLLDFFWRRVKQNLRVILCISPSTSSLRSHARLYPSLMACMSVDWFLDWPEEALYDVGMKDLETCASVPPHLISLLCQVFVKGHASAQQANCLHNKSRHGKALISPVRYLDTLKHFRELLIEKHSELGSYSSKLKSGVSKLQETRQQVVEMQVVCEAKRRVVAEAKQNAEQILIHIVQDKRIVDEQEMQVSQATQKISKETAEANAVAEECQAALELALPALLAAEEALNVLTKKDIAELKGYLKPPPVVELTLAGVMTVLKKPPTWEESKKQMGDPSFLDSLLRYNRDLLDDVQLKKINRYTTNPDFAPEVVEKVSGACKGLCMWVRAMEVYGNTVKEVSPKRARAKAAQKDLVKKEAALAESQAHLSTVLQKVEKLKLQYEEAIMRKMELERDLEEVAAKLQRAEKLLRELAGEQSAWQAAIRQLDKSLECLAGDCAITAIFLNYGGPFTARVREKLLNESWLQHAQEIGLQASQDFNVLNFLAKPLLLQEWRGFGLPSDDFSAQNALIITRTRRWPLIVDPQAQAVPWIKKLEGRNGLIFMDFDAPDLLRQLSNSVRYGIPVLLQGFTGVMDPSLSQLFSKSFIHRDHDACVLIGEKTVPVNTDFRLYVQTCKDGATLAEDVSTVFSIVNFAVTEEGLVDQLQSSIVRFERPDMEQQQLQLIQRITDGQKAQMELEDQILELLKSASGSLLDDMALIDTLEASKTTSRNGAEALQTAEQNSRALKDWALCYKPAAAHAAQLYFALMDMAAISPMYRFSLAAFRSIFQQSLLKAAKSDKVQDRIRHISDHFTLAFFKQAVRGLAGIHKLLFGIHVVTSLSLAAGRIPREEWNFFLRGGRVVDRLGQPANPSPQWLSGTSWDAITQLDHIPSFKGIAGSLEASNHQWEEWWRLPAPCLEELPGEWEPKSNELQRLILLRCLRPDRLALAGTMYLASSLGRSYADCLRCDMSEVVEDVGPCTPVLLLLSPGVDPAPKLEALAAVNGMAGKLRSVALGQGQAERALAAVATAAREGWWLYLTNAHLMASFLPTLEKTVQDLEALSPHRDFRLWISAAPTADFPTGLLQACHKFAVEPPQGLKSSLYQLYGSCTEASFSECRAPGPFQKLSFVLAFFHSVLLERSRFKALGFNLPYDFNDTDFQVSRDLLRSYLDYLQGTPWDALRFIIGEAFYGGRVTDDMDRRVVIAYITKFFTPAALSAPNFQLSSLTSYSVPDAATLELCKGYIGTLPNVDLPEAVGQHPNAEISFRREETMTLLEGLLAMHNATEGVVGEARKDEDLQRVVEEILSQLPRPVAVKDGTVPSPFSAVLEQEAHCYNTLLSHIRVSCDALLAALQGLAPLSSNLVELSDALRDGKVPQAWLAAYPSNKGLGTWNRDLVARVDQLWRWVDPGVPPVVWLSGLAFPRTFLTAVLQDFARRRGVPLDTLEFEFSVVNVPERDILEPAKEGVYVKGIFLDGAGWDHDNGCLCEPKPMQLVVAMPILLFRPTAEKQVGAKGIYECPLYMTSQRASVTGESQQLLRVDLKAGAAEPLHWVLRGTALLLSLPD